MTADPSNQDPRPGPLPFMKSFEDAQAISEKAQDPFFLDAFMIQAWLGTVVLDAATEYAQKKQPRERQMQTGQAWRRFLELFGHAKDDEFHHVLQNLLRFAQYDNAQAEILGRALLPLSLESGTPGALLATDPAASAQPPEKAAPLMRQSVQRWCDWIDAVVHWQTHFRYHLLPASFDPDADKRELAALGLMQRGFSALSDSSKARWQWHHREAAERLKDSPKRPTLGRIMAAPLRDDAGPAAVDQVAISLWPLLKRHNWTYRDLMAVARKVLPPPHRYPLEREQDLAAYCRNVLGMRKPPGLPGRSSPDGSPPGSEVALKLCRPPSGSS